MKTWLSKFVSLLLLAGLASWVLSAEVIVGGAPSAEMHLAALSSDATPTPLFKVKVFQIQQSQFRQRVRLLGITESANKVSIRAETTGMVLNRRVNKGQQIKAGDAICVLDPGSRKANLREAKSEVQRLNADYRATLGLVKDGIAPRAKARELKAKVAAADAAFAEAELELKKTIIRSTVSGLASDPMVVPGDTMAIGNVCITVMNADAMMFVGQVHEQVVAKLHVDMPATVELVTGEQVMGTIKHISRIADPDTRTLRTEIQIEKPSSRLRDGITAQAEVLLEPKKALKIQPSWLVLSDTGILGLYSVDVANKVKFHPVEVLYRDEGAMWVTGLPEQSRIIVLGQNYTLEGETVVPLAVDRMGRPLDSKAPSLPFLEFASDRRGLLERSQ
jgi:multidrug efflux system membrane fusion protein